MFSVIEKQRILGWLKVITSTAEPNPGTDKKILLINGNVKGETTVIFQIISPSCLRASNNPMATLTDKFKLRTPGSAMGM